MGSSKSNDEKQKRLNRRKRKRSSHSSSDSDSSLTSIDTKTKKKLLKKLKKLKKKERKKKNIRECEKKLKRERMKSDKNKINDTKHENTLSVGKSRDFTPLTKEQWEKQQNTLKRVYDEETGRTRLIKGTGEIVEECVSKGRHLAINKQATMKDGEYFQKVLSMNLK